MKNIECEIRSFITKKQYLNLIKKFKKEAKFLGEDEQITYYFDSKQDLRIQKNSKFSKIWLKSGKIHDENREELEVRADKKEFEKMEQIFSAIGYKIEIKWFRKRASFKWKGIDVAIDFTKGYGYIIELEKMTTEKEKEKTLAYLKKQLSGLRINLTPKEEFDRKYQYFKENWEKLTR